MNKKALRFNYFIFISLIFTSCFHGNRLDEVKYDKLFHGGQTRIWIINFSYHSESDLKINSGIKNKLFVFSSNGTLLLSDFSELYNGGGIKGTFSVYSENKEIDINFGKERWFFTFEVKDEHQILLRPNQGSDAKQNIILTSIPEI